MSQRRCAGRGPSRHSGFTLCRRWWDFCFIFGVAWLTITQVFILLISMFDANLTKAQCVVFAPPP